MIEGNESSLFGDLPPANIATLPDAGGMKRHAVQTSGENEKEGEGQICKKPKKGIKKGK